MQRLKNRPIVNPRSRKPRTTLPNISPGLSLQLLVIKRPIRKIGKNNSTKLVQNHVAKNGALNSESAYGLTFTDDIDTTGIFEIEAGI